MTSKDWKWIAIACLLVVVAYQAGKYSGENSAQSRSRESELAFQKEKEATRKYEFSKLLRIQEEEKQAMEKRRIEDAREARDLAAMQSFTQSQDRQMALAIQAMQAISQRQGGGPTQSQDRQMAILREYLESLQNIQRQPSR